MINFTSTARTACLALTLMGGATLAAAEGAWKFSEARVGQVFVASSQSTCGGTLVGSDLVLTAAHCVVLEDSSDPVDIRDVSFSFVNGEGDPEVFEVVDIATDPAFVRQLAPTRESISRDIALLRLSRQILGGVESMSDLDENQTHLALLPVASDTAFVGEPCKADYEENGIVVLSCERAKGSSGSPAYSLIDGQRKVVAVISANGRQNDVGITFAANPMASLANMQWIGKIRATPGQF